MSTVKFSLQEELNELQAKIYLRSKRKFSKQKILETIYLLGSRDINQLIDLLLSQNNEILDRDDNDYLFKWLNSVEDGIEDTDSVKDHDVIH